MKARLLKIVSKLLPPLLYRAPRFSAYLLSVFFKNKNLTQLSVRPGMLQRAGKTLSTGGIFISQLNVTNACNQKCPMCNLWEEGSRMPLDQVKLSIDRIAELGSFMITITGGEPFTHPHIGEIIDYAYHKDLFINVNTNASVPLRIYESVDLSKISVAIISLHALDSEKIERITGVPNILPRVQKTLEYFKKHTKMRLILKFVLQKDNESELEDVQQFAEQNGFTVEYHPVMVDTNNRPVTTNKQELLLTQPAQLKSLEKIQSFKKSGRSFESNIYYQFCIDALKKGNLQWSCDGGIHYLSVYPDGRFGICKDVYTSAKITDPDFLEKYHSLQFQKEMKQLRESCSGCNWSCYITASKMAQMVKNPDPNDLALVKSF